MAKGPPPKAPKANLKADKPSSSPARTGSSNLRTLAITLKVAVLVLIIGCSNYASQLALHPLYGANTTSLHFPYIVAGSMSLSMVIPARPWMERSLLNVLSTVLCLAPYTAYTFGAWTARWRDEVRGPAVAQLGLAIPVMIAGALLIRVTVLFSLLKIKEETRFMRSVGFATTFAWVQMLLGVIDSKMPRGGYYTSCNIFLALGGASLLLSLAHHFAPTTSPAPEAKASSASQKTPTAKLAVVALNLALLAMSKTNRPCNSPEYPYQKGQVRVLAAQDSVTGMISVAESLTEGFRYMRCDHSLLGGVWMGDDKTPALSTSRNNPTSAGGVDLQGTKLGDSIYSAFVLQDGMRLFDRGEGTVNNGGQSALVIGLGAGIMARSLWLVGIKPTIVEIDPVVYEYAFRFFNMQRQPRFVENGTNYLHPPTEPQTHFMDAREFVHKRASLLQGMRPLKESMRYDFIVHDVFSGGMVPTHLFTTEFWEEAKVVMKLNGIIAVNFAGKVQSNAAKAILITLENSFSKCRAFHDKIMSTPGEKAYTDDEFINLVFFCTQSESIDLSLRPHRQDDYIDSYLRRHIFQRFDQLEVPRQDILGNEELDKDIYTITDSYRPLKMWQEKAAVDHWKLMREVLPDATWETY